jgi:hypothetical protein
LGWMRLNSPHRARSRLSTDATAKTTSMSRSGKFTSHSLHAASLGHLYALEDGARRGDTGGRSSQWKPADIGTAKRTYRNQTSITHDAKALQRSNGGRFDRNLQHAPRRASFSAGCP